MPAFAAGQLRHSVVLEQRKQGVDGGHDLKTSYVEVGDAFAAIEGVGGAAYQAGVQIEERITHRITIRYRPRTDFNRIRRSGTEQRFKVQRLRDPDGTRRWLVIEAEELKPGEDDL
jgi:head-tail adaptor